MVVRKKDVPPGYAPPFLADLVPLLGEVTLISMKGASAQFDREDYLHLWACAYLYCRDEQITDPARVHLLARPTLASALGFAALVAVALGLLVYLLVFRPLRQAPALARVVASRGLLLYLQEIVRLRFPVAGASVVTRRPVLSDEPVALFGTTVTENRLILAGLVVVVALLLGAVFRFTRFGLATRAAAGNEKGALLLGISPDRLASGCWAVASVLPSVTTIISLL